MPTKKSLAKRVVPKDRAATAIAIMPGTTPDLIVMTALFAALCIVFALMAYWRYAV